MIRNPLQFINLSSLKQELLPECTLRTCITQDVILLLDCFPYNRQHRCCRGLIMMPVQQCSVLCFKKLSVLLHFLHFCRNEHAFQFTQEITISFAKYCIPNYATLTYTAVHGTQSKLTEGSNNTAFKRQTVKMYRTKTGKMKTFSGLNIKSNCVGVLL